MILKYLAERPDGELSNATEIRKGIGLTTQDHDRVVVAIDVMIEDSYIKPFDPGNVYETTHSGREHLKEGGYTQENYKQKMKEAKDEADREKREKRKQTDRLISNTEIIIGAVVGVLSLIANIVMGILLANCS